VSLLHEVERVLYDELLPSTMMHQLAAVEASDLAGIIYERGQLRLVPLESYTYDQTHPSEYPKRPVEKLDLDAHDTLRSLFSRGEAWDTLSDRGLYVATLKVARSDHGEGRHGTRFAGRLCAAVNLAILARRGVRLATRDGLPNVRTDADALDADSSSSPSSTPDSDSLLSPQHSAADSFAASPVTTVSNNLSEYGVHL
jgi:hypothetical protein